MTLSVMDSLGCRAVDSLLLRVEPNVFAPNVINPNSENDNNQFFTLFSKEQLPIHRLSVYDRWGEHVFETRNITTNVPLQGWDATFRGKNVEAAVYIFLAEVEVLPGKTVLIKGDVTVLY